ncbi:hypothetical protein AB0H23_32370 [Streptomyces albogriseolus]|uniref:hypothetical protein n=1 Tax=Streptomyces albogriseolus TaxID=1887 RepID=UPI003460A3FF
MDSAAAFTAAFALTAAAGIVARYIVRAGAPLARRQAVPDSEEGRRAHTRSRQAYIDFTEPATRIAATAELWPALDDPAARRERRTQARELLQDLKRREPVIALDAGPDVRSAARALVEDCERLVEELDVSAPTGPVLTLQQELTMPFLRACREYLDAESERHFALRRPAGRSLFARLSTR